MVSRLLILLLALLVAAPAFAAGQRVALVIGNSKYSHAPALPNPARDVELMATTLEQSGFAVTKIVDADRDGLKRAMLQFGRTLREQDIEAGLFYYAGHGVQVKGENFLIPVDASVQSEDEIEIQAVNVNEFLNLMNSSRSKVNIVILDACRDNPFKGSTRSLSRGLAAVDAPKGTYIAYATSPGQVALDGAGTNSPYTTALVNAMAEPGVPIERVFKNARSQVLAATSDQQLPWETSSITGEFFFKADGAAPVVVAPQPQPMPQPEPQRQPVPEVQRQPEPEPEQEVAMQETPRSLAAPRWGVCRKSRTAGGEVCASSVLEPQFGNRYGVGNLFDNAGGTAWVEGAKGDGIGQGIVIKFDSPRHVRLLSLRNGYNKNRDIYTKNNRVRRIVVTDSAGGTHDYDDLLDSGEWQQLTIGGAGPVTWVAVTIRSVYRGSKYRDTAISELRVE